MFYFLGYHFGPAGPTVAAKTIARFGARATRLYEQEPGKALASSRSLMYVQRRVSWASAGLERAMNMTPLCQTSPNYPSSSFLAHSRRRG